MRIVLLGVGEAADERLPNTSILVEAEARLLLDCGYSMPPLLWQHSRLQPDGIFISHSHADHCFGLPAILLRFWMEKRKAPLSIICQHSQVKPLQRIVDLAYPGLMAKLLFQIEFLQVTPKSEIVWRGLKLGFAPTKHFVSNLAIKVEQGKSTLCYSGDGEITPQAIQLYKGSSLLVAEGYSFEQKIEGHTSIKELLNLKKSIGVKRLIIVHVSRETRLRQLTQIKSWLRKNSPDSALGVPLQEIEI